jgi:xylan 1,4-beta-xylosidase
MMTMLNVISLTLLLSPLTAPDPHILQVDFGRRPSTFRALHGVNKGPITAGGLIDLTNDQAALGLPFIRLHDCHWPNPDVVDMHVVFPNPDADPEDPASYDFRLTDEYIAAARATGAQIIYRLGESIEHTSVKRFAHPPKDPAKWAAVALGIIRHYNQGWSNGHHWNIQYWEIWNEPENRPAMWSGTDDQYFELYRTAAAAIKRRYPDLKVGGPGIGDTGQTFGGALRPSAFLTAFLDLCRRERLPLDFLSWHCYTDDPIELAVRARSIRRLLDERGLVRTKNHLNEWGYLPDKSWNGTQRSSTAIVRQRFFDRISGAEGAAFVVATLLRLQDVPLDVSCLFHGETGGFGLFNTNGIPMKTYYALKAFRELMLTPTRVQVAGRPPVGVTAVAGARDDRRAATILVSSQARSAVELRFGMRGLPWRGGTSYDIRVLNATRDLQSVREGGKVISGSISLTVEPSSVVLIALRPGG